MKRYPSLNGLRAVSIIIVIISHFEYKHYFKLNNIFSPNSLSVLSDGQFGVNVFFVISGFLITSLLIAEENKKGSINLKNFYVRRTLRIFPAYYFLLFVYFILELLHYIEIPRISWITSLTYTKDFFIGNDWYTGHFWSLSIEEHFYFFWPFLFLVKKLRKYAPWLIILVQLLFKYPYSYYFPNKLSSYDLNFLMRIDSIAIGCLFAIHKDKILSILEKNQKLLVAGAVLLLIVLSMIQNNLPADASADLRLLHSLFGSTHGVLANFSIAIIMMYSVFGPKGWWYHFLNNKVMNFIGILSYSLYLWQELFINDTGYIINRFPLNIILIFLAATSSYYLVEKPFLKLKSRFGKSVQ